MEAFSELTLVRKKQKPHPHHVLSIAIERILEFASKNCRSHLLVPICDAHFFAKMKRFFETPPKMAFLGRNGQKLVLNQTTLRHFILKKRQRPRIKCIGNWTEGVVGE